MFHISSSRRALASFGSDMVLVRKTGLATFCSRPAEHYAIMWNYAASTPAHCNLSFSESNTFTSAMETESGNHKTISE